MDDSGRPVVRPGDGGDGVATAIVAPGGEGGAALEVAIGAWLDAKYRRSNSAKTRTAYANALAEFRGQLALRGLDLASDDRAVALVAQVWASRREDGQTNVAPTTYNQRLAILSSFYTFARRRGLLECPNPILRLDRRKVQEYAGARPLDFRTVEAKLAAIDRGEWAGVRDYALLLVGLHTGRRAAELAGMAWGRLQLEGGKITVTFPAKGGKVMSDTLPPNVAAALWRWIQLLYGDRLAQDLPPTAPIWVALDQASGWRGDGKRLSHQAVSAICLKRLGTSKVHALRHTFAHGMEQVGAKVSEIQARLGHSNLATTGKYLAALSSADNPYGTRLEALYGVAEQPDLAKIQRRRRRYTNKD